MDPVSSAVLAKALDGLSRRMDVIASNIANANSRGFSPQQVRFEDALRLAASHNASEVAAVPITVEPVQGQKSGEVRMDLEVLEASQTAGRYSAMLGLLGREFELSRIAVGGGQG
ncbi:flagellar basal body rod protein FlgB [Novosphingobium fuchskuhlense]|uniref:flagellar basal body rod protein FlgB n=1 Tax=Novosphingobium fuchskuhlense TaxID=1117702 RepID=UPI000B29C7AD|nr:flagellar basal body protein [Novosphingobium fuchskuhlense]